MKASLNREPTAAEIKEALFQMHPTKAPGPDGFHALFYQHFWSIVELKVVDLVLKWWRGLISLEGINKTCITFMSKCKAPKSMTEFRPISCCNVIHNILSKVMTNKQKPFLGAIIALKVFHSMKHKSSSSKGSLVIKLDMSKAYDRVEWVFLEWVILNMGFSDAWVRRIMSCITIVQFSLKLNGSIFSNLIPSKGLR